MIVMASGHRLGDRVGGYGDAYNAMKATARKALKAMAYTPDKVLSGMAAVSYTHLTLPTIYSV